MPCHNETVIGPGSKSTESGGCDTGSESAPCWLPWPNVGSIRRRPSARRSRKRKGAH